MADTKNVGGFLLNNGVVGVKPEGITLKSGRTSHWYANARNLSTSVNALDGASDFVLERLQAKGSKPIEDNLDEFEPQPSIIEGGMDAFVGVPEGATELGIHVNERLIRDGLIADKLYPIRVVPKSHGDPNGMWKTGNKPGKVVVYEDVGTTGESSLQFIDKLRKAGLNVEDVIVLLNRMQLSDSGMNIEERFESEGIKLHSLATATEVLPELLARLELTNPELAQEMRRRINQEYKSEYEDAGRESPINLEETR